MIFFNSLKYLYPASIIKWYMTTYLNEWYSYGTRFEMTLHLITHAAYELMWYDKHQDVGILNWSYQVRVSYLKWRENQIVISTCKFSFWCPDTVATKFHQWNSSAIQGYFKDLFVILKDVQPRSNSCEKAAWRRQFEELVCNVLHWAQNSRIIFKMLGLFKDVATLPDPVHLSEWGITWKCMACAYGT